MRRNAKGRVGDSEWTLIHDWFKHETQDKQEIADRLRVSRGAVAFALQHSEPPSRRKRNDPPPIPKSEAQKMLKRRALVLHLAKMVATDGRTRRKFPSCKQIAEEIRRHVGYDRCHPATVYRDLLFMGGVCLERPRTSTEKGKADPVQRFNCCEYFLDHVDIQWMLFSDEVYFDDNDHGMRTQWCFNGERPMPRTDTQFCTTAHFWGVIGKDFRFLMELPPGMGLGATSADFIRVCLTPLKAALAAHRNRDKYVFQQDGHPIHESKESIAWMAANGINALGKGRWPAYSPDLSPIENIWKLMHSMISDMIPDGSAHLTDDQRKAVLRKNAWKAWSQIPQSTLNKYVASARGRFEEVIGSGGLRTNH